ncbi:MAG: ABC transporter permease [Thermodesulfobacteriota bacterium]
MRTALNFARVASWFVLRQWMLRKWRTLAVIAGVALGASVFLGVRLAASTSAEAFRRGMDALDGGAAMVAASPGSRVDDRLTGALLRSPAVLHAAPMLSAYVQAADGRPLRLVGIDPMLDRPFRLTLLKLGTDSQPDILALMARPRTILLGAPAAERLNAPPGSRIELEHAGRREEFTVLGVLDAQGLAGVEAGQAAVADIATVQEFLGLQGLLDRIDIIPAPGAAAADIQAVLPGGVLAGPPGEPKRSGMAMIGAYELNLTVLSFVSLFVGMYLVYSLVSLDAASRRKEIAVLRALGAGPGLVRGLFLLQGCLLGLLGWLAGMPLAALATGALLEGVSATVNNLFVRVAVSGSEMDPAEAALSLAVTVGISVLASAGPASRSMRVPPREAMAMHASDRTESTARPRSWTIAGATLCALVWPVCALPSPAGFPLPGYLAIFMLFTGLSLLAPEIFGVCLATLSPAFSRSGVSARLAASQSASGAARTAVAVGALATAMALFIALSTMIHSFRASFETWLGQTVTGDLFVRPSMAELNDYRDSLPDGLAPWLKARGGVEVLPYLRRYLTMNGVPFQFEATDMPMLLGLSSFAVLDSLPDARSLLLEGCGVAIAEALANQAGLKPGDRFRVVAGRAVVDATVAMVVRSYRTRGGEAYFDLEAFRKLGGESGAGGLRIYFKDRKGDLDARAGELRDELLAGPFGSGIEAVPGAALHRIVKDIFDETFALTTVLLVIALGVAALGVSVTLTVRVLERSLQLSTLFALGASRAQVTAMVLWEAVYLGLAGEIAGMAGGLALSLILVFVVNRDSFGWTFIYLTDWRAMALSLPLILATVLAAGPPACRAALSRPPALALRER